MLIFAYCTPHSHNRPSHVASDPLHVMNKCISEIQNNFICLIMFVFVIRMPSMANKSDTSLGVLISDNISWNAHVDTVTKKANNMNAFLCRNLSSCPQHIKETCYKTFVRP